MDRKDSATPAELSPSLRRELEVLAEQGGRQEGEGREDDALRTWQAALDLIPRPRNIYAETVWFLAAAGNIHFRRGRFAQARACFDEARENASGDGRDNVFVMLRLGECCHELGDEENAVAYLLRAYQMDGEEFFLNDDDLPEGGGEKYLAFLKERVTLPEDGRTEGNGPSGADVIARYGALENEDARMELLRGVSDVDAALFSFLRDVAGNEGESMETRRAALRALALHGDDDAVKKTLRDFVSPDGNAAFNAACLGELRRLPVAEEELCLAADILTKGNWPEETRSEARALLAANDDKPGVAPLLQRLAQTGTAR